MSKAPRADRLRVVTPQGQSGLLASVTGSYVFAYLAEAAKSAEISLLMPLRVEQYSARELHPIFQMNLPEGYVLESLRNRFAKVAVVDPMLLLALTGSETPIGRVRVEAPAQLLENLGVTPQDHRGERLDEILAWDGAENLFNALARRYLFRTGVSGVQPKLLVPETPPAGKTSLSTTDLIVKSGGADFPGLAVNEYVCMSAAREAGIPVPEFFLSDNRQLFVMRRFDRTDAGEPLGFEEMVVLMGKGAAQKYDGSYESVARFMALYCSPQRKHAALAQLFDQVALSCIIGNGDAHLKNFGVIYSDPTSEDVRMSPAYDMVNTTAYIADDSLALTLGGSKSLLASRLHLLEFGQRCEIDAPRDRIGELLDAVEYVLDKHRALLDTEPQVQQGLRAAFDGFAGRFDRGQRPTPR